MKDNFMSNDDEIPEIMTEQENPWKKAKGLPGVKFDGNQKNGKGGSPMMEHKIGTGKSTAPDWGGTINYNNTQTFGGITNVDDDNMQWEEKNKIVVDPTKEWVDTHNGFEAKEIDFTGHLDGKSIGMPDVDESLSPDCGRY